MLLFQVPHDENLPTLFKIQEDLAGGIREMSILPEHSPFPAAVVQIHRLPPEILAAIFVHLSNQEPDPLGSDLPRSIQDLVSVSHVCKFWREVAVTTPDLWTEINMTNLEAVEIFLERSGAVPLNVELRSANEDILQTVAAHAHRFRRFSVSTPRNPRYNPFAALRKPAPLLERLEISYPLDFQPYTVFNDQAPRLRELTIFTSGPWLKNQLGNLTSLHLTLRDAVLPYSQFLPFFDMLRRCPALEEMFVWWNTWSMAPPTSTTRPPTIPLHRLRKLLLRSFRIENIQYLLHSLELVNNGIAIHLSDVNLEGDEEHFVPRIQAVFQNHNPCRPSLASCTKLVLSRARAVYILYYTRLL